MLRPLRNRLILGHILSMGGPEVEHYPGFGAPHGERIELDSAPGLGRKFTLQLPVNCLGMAMSDRLPARGSLVKPPKMII